MAEALGGFDPKSIYDEASRDYESAARDFWQYISIRTVDMLDLKPGDRVLDVPCGSGASLVVAGQRVGPSGRVVGVDYAEQMVAVAEEKVRADGLTNVELSVGDMTRLDELKLEPFDAVVCSLGLFFADDMAALAGSLFELVRRGGGRLGLAVFGDHVFDPMRQVFVEIVGDLVPHVEVLQPWRRTEDPSVLSSILETAGIEPVTIETHDDHLPLHSPDHWWRIVMGSGFRRTVAVLDEPTASELRRRCDAYVRDHGVDQIISRTHYALIVDGAQSHP